MKISYEGEGDLIGIKTAFYDYPEDKLTSIPGGIEAVYIRTSKVDEPLLGWVSDTGVRYKTIECLVDEYIHREGIRWFVDCGRYSRIECKKDVFIKVQIFTNNEKEWIQKIATARSFAEDGHAVLLMPLYLIGVESKMMRYLDFIHPLVRLCPPVHTLLGIP